tara:strand:+ start:646 stop:987 length:342 start_codon:yes stop_codon:yes gene_type:complete
MYREERILNFVIDNESSGPQGLDVDMHVSTNEEVIIHIGSSMTIRTSESGASDLILGLERALAEIENIRYEKTSSSMEELSENMNPPKQDKTAGEVQSVDVFDLSYSNDPINW